MKNGMNFKKIGLKPLVCVAIVSFQLLSSSSFAQFSGGNGTSASPYMISTAAELAQLATYVNAGDTNYNDKHYKLANNIDLSAYGAGFNNGKGWIPIGKYDLTIHEEYPFKGTFNGDSNKITGLYINDSTPSYSTGLFGCTHRASIHNMILENVNIRGNAFVGAITGDDWYSEFIDCSSSGTIRGGAWVGGIVGRIRDVIILDGSSEIAILTRCHSSCNVSGSGNSVGGIAGDIGQHCNIGVCYSTGNVSGRDYVGGLVGKFSRFADLRLSYSTGNVTGNNYVGGITGYLYSSILYQGYSTGSITGNQHVGGIVGEVNQDCCLTTNIIGFVALNSSIKGNNHVGRIVGDVYALPPMNNAAYDSILDNAGTALWLNKGANQIDGEDISKETIHADSTLGGRFTYWTTQNGKLPGLGKSVDMPKHLQKGGSGGTSIAEQNNSDIRVYPNPAQHTLYIESAETVEHVSIYDISGRIVVAYGIRPEPSIDVSTLANGIYLVKVKTAQGETIKKIVIND